MAHQTSAIQRKQTTPRPIGRLIDVDFFGVIFLFLVAYESSIGTVPRLADRRNDH
jgi:hypothetical protein